LLFALHLFTIPTNYHVICIEITVTTNWNKNYILALEEAL